MFEVLVGCLLASVLSQGVRSTTGTIAGNVSPITIFERTISTNCERFAFSSLSDGQWLVAEMMVKNLESSKRAMFAWKHLRGSPRTTARSGKASNELLLRDDNLIEEMKRVDTAFETKATYLWKVFHGAMEQADPRGAAIRKKFLESPGACFFIEAYIDSLLAMVDDNGMEKVIRLDAWKRRQELHREDKEELKGLADRLDFLKKAQGPFEATVSVIFTPEHAILSETLVNPDKEQLVQCFAKLLAQSWSSLLKLSAHAKNEDLKIIDQFGSTFEGAPFFEAGVRDMLNPRTCSGTTYSGHKCVVFVKAEPFQNYYPTTGKDDVAANTKCVKTLKAVASTSTLSQKLHDDNMSIVRTSLLAQKVFLACVSFIFFLTDTLMLTLSCSH